MALWLGGTEVQVMQALGDEAPSSRYVVDKFHSSPWKDVNRRATVVLAVDVLDLPILVPSGWHR